MFSYTIDLLKRVSFDEGLFCKELEKAYDRLLPHEVVELERWLRVFLFDKPQLRRCPVLVQREKPRSF